MSRRAGALVVVALGLAACSTASSAEPSPVAESAPIDTAASATTVRPTTTTRPRPTTTAPPTTPAPTTTAAPPPTSTTVVDPAIAWPRLDAAVAGLAGGNATVSASVWRDGRPAHSTAAGVTQLLNPATPETPMVQASVSKVITMLTIVRLAHAGRIDLDAPVPWAALGLAHAPGWDAVTVRELLAHTGGMPPAQEAWFAPGGSCRDVLAPLLASGPRSFRGTWRYSNGNYCALGLLIEHVTGTSYDRAAYDQVFGPALVTGPHPSTAGAQGGDAPYLHPDGLAHLDRLGAAGQWIMSTDDVAAVLASMTPADLADLPFPTLFVDGYGVGHTGTVDGAKACAWRLEGGRTVVAATVSGDRPATGGQLCDRIVPAVAADLGLPVVNPNDRWP